MKTPTLITGLLLALTSLGAAAHYDGDRRGLHDHRDFDRSQRFEREIDQRQALQQARIRAGMRNGHLTRSEFRELMEEQQDIRRMERRFLADGRLSASEFARLDRALDAASRNIREEKWDRQARAPHYGHGPRAHD